MILILHCGQTARHKVYLFDCVEDGESQVCFTSLPRRHSSYHVCTICNSLFTVEGTLCVCACGSSRASQAVDICPKYRTAKPMVEEVSTSQQYEGTHDLNVAQLDAL